MKKITINLSYFQLSIMELACEKALKIAEKETEKKYSLQGDYEEILNLTKRCDCEK